MSVSRPDKRRQYDNAFKTEALRRARESRSMRAATRQLGLSEKLLHRWQQAQAVTKAGSVGQAQDPAYRALRAENQRLEHKVAISKSSGHLRPRDPMSACRFIERARRPSPGRELCQVLGVAPSTYYARRPRCSPPAPAWEQAGGRAFARHPRLSGTRRRRVELPAAGYQVGCYRSSPRSLVPCTTDSGHGQRVAPNRLPGQTRPTRPDQV